MHPKQEYHHQIDNKVKLWQQNSVKEINLESQRSNFNILHKNTNKKQLLDRIYKNM